MNLNVNNEGVMMELKRENLDSDPDKIEAQDLSNVTVFGAVDNECGD